MSFFTIKTAVGNHEPLPLQLVCFTPTCQEVYVTAVHIKIYLCNFTFFLNFFNSHHFDKNCPKQRKKWPYWPATYLLTGLDRKGMGKKKSGSMMPRCQMEKLTQRLFGKLILPSDCTPDDVLFYEPNSKVIFNSAKHIFYMSTSPK